VFNLAGRHSSLPGRQSRIGPQDPREAGPYFYFYIYLIDLFLSLFFIVLHFFGSMNLFWSQLYLGILGYKIYILI
jgi:hypothetical protein